MSDLIRSTLRGRLSAHFRNKRAVTLRRLIDQLTCTHNKLTILDIGGRARYWEQIGIPFLRERNVSVTILNLHRSEFADRDLADIFTFQVGDARSLTYPDGHFDLAHSNSVIEHVGGWPDMQEFARETRRIAKSYYVQTPYFWFPIDPHFYAMPMFHWLPRVARALVLRAVPLATSGRARTYKGAVQAVNSSRLLNIAQFRILFPDAEIEAERFARLPKSLIAIRR